jgi:hypothetical protein
MPTVEMTAPRIPNGWVGRNRKQMFHSLLLLVLTRDASNSRSSGLPKPLGGVTWVSPK